MKVAIEGLELVVRPGGLRGVTRVPLAEISSWDILYELLGRRYLAFHLGDRTAYAQLPRLAVEARDALVAELTALTGRAPDVSLLESERDNEHWIKVWEYIKWIGSYLRLFINPMRPPGKRPKG
ncbi:hypothetical protein [Perlucidibaca aquatica]|uniref:hypothetical protein n=1 Tax=Perlucidibaca aquatica TaxID=1852776 RepID=UPI00083B90F9|nr:hypothetical protein [Perlucidibaca aquatica]